MGCDIHAYKEKLVDGKWVTADKGWQDEYDEGYVDIPWKNRYTDRNYNLFGLLAGVRCEHAFSWEPRGLPADVCSEVAALSEHWDGDGHSHSYLLLGELKEMQKRLESEMVTISGMKDPAELAKLQASIDSGTPNWDLLYPYCQWSSSMGYVNFNIEVPATFAADLTPIIELFDEADGPDQRLVFWFDN